MTICALSTLGRILAGLYRNSYAKMKNTLSINKNQRTDAKKLLKNPSLEGEEGKLVSTENLYFIEQTKRQYTLFREPLYILFTFPLV